MNIFMYNINHQINMWPSVKRTPIHCPSCDSELSVTRLVCTSCSTEVAGEYQLTPLLRLSPEDQSFVETFMIESGSLKAMASALGVSYPTVRNRLDEIIAKLGEK